MTNACPIRGWRVALLLTGVACLCLPARAGRLQTRFTTVTVHDLPVGFWTRVELEDGEPYTVENTSTQKVRVNLKASRPFEAKAVGSGYRMIPDAAWITVEPAMLDIEPQSSAGAEVRITVPDDPKYAGQRYEGWLVATGVGPQFQVGLITRIRFNTVAKPEEPAQEIEDTEAASE